MFNHKKLKQLRGEKPIVDVIFEMRNKNIDISYSAYWSYEHGNTCPSFNDVCSIAKYYGVGIEDFFC